MQYFLTKNSRFLFKDMKFQQKRKKLKLKKMGGIFLYYLGTKLELN